MTDYIKKTVGESLLRMFLRDAFVLGVLGAIRMWLKFESSNEWSDTRTRCAQVALFAQYKYICTQYKCIYNLSYTYNMRSHELFMSFLLAVFTVVEVIRVTSEWYTDKWMCWRCANIAHYNGADALNIVECCLNGCSNRVSKDDQHNKLQMEI